MGKKNKLKKKAAKKKSKKSAKGRVSKTQKKRHLRSTKKKSDQFFAKQKKRKLKKATLPREKKGRAKYQVRSKKALLKKMRPKKRQSPQSKARKFLKSKNKKWGLRLLVNTTPNGTSSPTIKVKRKPFFLNKLKTKLFSNDVNPKANEILVSRAPEFPSVVEIGKAQNGLSTEELKKPGESLKRSIESFLLDQRSEHTRTAYGKDLKRFIKYLLHRGSARGPESIDRHVVIGYKELLLSEGLKHTSVDRHLATLRSFFQWLVDDGILEKSPAAAVRFMNPGRLSTTLGFTDLEVRKVLDQPNLHRRAGALHYAILMVLFFCGMRRSEVCSIKTAHIGKERGYPILRLVGKGNKERILVLIPQVWNAIRYYLRMSGKSLLKNEFLFTPVKNNVSGVLQKPLDPSSIFYIVRKYSRAAGLTHRVSPHSCRATAISNARDKNIPDRAIQEFAGWASPDMITRYDKRKSMIEKSAGLAIQYGNSERDFPWIPSQHPDPFEEKRLLESLDTQEKPMQKSNDENLDPLKPPTSKNDSLTYSDKDS